MPKVFEAAAKDGMILLPKDVPLSARCLVTVMDDGTESLNHQATLLQQEFERESEAFERLLPSLLLTRPGRFVAIHDGLVMDEDVNEIALARRVESTCRNKFVLIRRVSQDATEDYLESPEVDGP